MLNCLRLRKTGYDLLMADIRMSDFDDPYGTGSDWAFSLAEVLYVRFDVTVPDFEPSPFLGPNYMFEEYTAELVCEYVDDGEVTQSDLLKAYHLSVVT